MRGQTRRIGWRKATHDHAQFDSVFLPKEKQNLKKRKSWSFRTLDTRTHWTIEILLFWGYWSRSSPRKWKSQTVQGVLDQKQIKETKVFYFFFFWGCLLRFKPKNFWRPWHDHPKNKKKPPCKTCNLCNITKKTKKKNVYISVESRVSSSCVP